PIVPRGFVVCATTATRYGVAGERPRVDARRSAAVLRRARPIVVHDPSSPPRVSREPRRPDARWIAGGGAAGHSMVRRRAAPLRRHSLALSPLPRTFQPMIGMPRKQL